MNPYRKGLAERACWELIEQLINFRIIVVYPYTKIYINGFPSYITQIYVDYDPLQ